MNRFASTCAVIDMMYGLLVGISCLVALGAIVNSYHYASMQGQLGVLASSYGGVVRLEGFQQSIYQANNLSAASSDAEIDGITLQAFNGIATLRDVGYQSSYIYPDMPHR